MSYNLNQIDPDGRPKLYAEPREEIAPARPRRLLAAVTALLVMCLFAAGLWFAYIEGLRHANGAGSGNDVPLIRADARPIKVKPANPGGMAIPDRNLLIYDEGRPTTEHLLPPPEQPMARPAPPAPTPLPPPAQTGPQQQQAAAPAMTGRVSDAAAVAPVVTDRGATPAAALLQQNGHANTAEHNAANAPPVPHRVSHEAVQAIGAAAAAGDVRLQLGSVRSAVSAREEWERIRRSNADLLGNLSAAAVRADLGDRGIYFRIQTAPVGDVAHASRLCGELRQRHLGCIIVR